MTEEVTEVREIVAGYPNAGFSEKYPKLARILEGLRDEPDAEKRESTVVFVEKLVALAAQENRESATKKAGLMIFGRCAASETRTKLASALATSDEAYCDAQIDLLARSLAERGGEPSAGRTGR